MDTNLIKKQNSSSLSINDIHKGDVLVAKYTNMPNSKEYRNYIIFIAREKYNSIKDSIPIFALIGFLGMFNANLSLEVARIKAKNVVISKPTISQYLELAYYLRINNNKFNKKSRNITTYYNYD